MARRPRLPPPDWRRGENDDGDDWPVDRGRPLGLRLLALVGALAFVMLGINSLLPVLQRPQQPPSLPSHAG
ncbi:hypothetical protein KBY66_12930 [Synechococcus sp. Tobar12-5m-g]|uniref:hypothetical protein n=1 Tax=unclassified Synechococcus TaxID=2626047 RepID=UPI0020CBC2D1|nr:MULTISPECIES: hypothetical protein [unclassified Synechococcus]MCP9773506.1 hypothetical protein [Synechococcus sp. Tobar12-5m-g]MCP9874509.1 hypothetical protein [Synechococcus sp. Cruz CV-v-12]